MNLHYRIFKLKAGVDGYHYFIRFYLDNGETVNALITQSVYVALKRAGVEVIEL